MFSIRRATPHDASAVLARTTAFNVDEGITVDRARLATALDHLLRQPELGVVWVVEDAGAIVGHAVVSYGYDLEFAGRDSFLTEVWVDPAVRGRGAATTLIETIAAELRAAGVHALHLQVRPDNPARRLYERSGFETSPRIAMTRRL